MQNNCCKFRVEAVILGRKTGALALYLFLCTVADAQGASYYSDGRVCELLGMGSAELKSTRRELMDAGLVAYSRPFYQVLSLDEHKMECPPGTPLRQCRKSAPATLNSLARSCVP